jgi:Fur family transcriptional regulator, peroxide stress response regulator
MFRVLMNRAEECVVGSSLNERLASGGFRFTPQRREVYAILLQKRDHPTAEEVFFRARGEMPGISMATVYNCLEALVKCRLVRQVTLDRGAARFCPNMSEHGHFCCDSCGTVLDIELPAGICVPLPKGFEVLHYDIAVHGRCPACSEA